MYNSILIAYRDRPKNLECCLKSLAKCPHKYPFDIHLVDLASTTNTAQVIDPFRDLIKIFHHQIEYSGPFHKSKALNYGLQKSKCQYVTILDVDMLVEEPFLRVIENFYDMIEAEANSPEGAIEAHDVKLSHRVFLLPQQPTETIHQNYDLWTMYVQPNLFALSAPEIHSETYTDETFGDVELGTGNFTLNRHRLIELGGYHEGFITYGLEDLELNWRLWKNGIHTEINTEAYMAHQSHGQDWSDPVAFRKNQQLLERQREQQWKIPVKKRTWGLFNGELNEVKNAKDEKDKTDKAA